MPSKIARSHEIKLGPSDRFNTDNSENGSIDKFNETKHFGNLRNQCKNINTEVVKEKVNRRTFR